VAVVVVVADANPEPIAGITDAASSVTSVNFQLPSFRYSAFRGGS
jgi:hypothetical protein